MSALALLVTAAVLADPPSAQEILRRAVERNETNHKLARNYTFVEREEERELDDKGKVMKTESNTYDVTLLQGSPYRRWMLKNDQPLSAKDEKKEKEKLEKSIEERQHESESKRAKRLAEYEKRREERSEERRV